MVSRILIWCQCQEGISYHSCYWISVLVPDQRSSWHCIKLDTGLRITPTPSRIGLESPKNQHQSSDDFWSKPEAFIRTFKYCISDTNPIGKRNISSNIFSSSQQIKLAHMHLCLTVIPLGLLSCGWLTCPRSPSGIWDYFLHILVTTLAVPCHGRRCYN